MDDEERLRAVFDLCDPHPEGYISVDKFLDLAAKHFSADFEDESEELREIITLLDPQEDKKIYFDDFCKGVQKIIEYKSLGQSGDSIRSHGSEETLIDQPLGSRETLIDDDDAKTHSQHSEVSTFGEYDLLTDDDNLPVNDSGVLVPDNVNFNTLPLPINVLPPSSEDDQDSAISGRSSDNQRRETDDEEHFEDFGEGEFSSEASDFSHHSEEPHKIPNSPNMKMPKLSSNALASHLYNKTPSTSNSRRSSISEPRSEDIFDDIDGNFQSLNDKVRRLEEHLSMVTSSQIKSDDRHSKLKDENSYLADRVHSLEEHIRDVELKSRDNLLVEDKRHKEALERQERHMNREIESLTTRLHHVENEYVNLKEEAPRLKYELEQLRKDRKRLEEDLEEQKYAYNDLQIRHCKLQDQYDSQQDKMREEGEVTGRLLDELSRELDELRKYRMENERETRCRSPSVTDLPSRYKELEAEIKKLRQENDMLHETNEELHVQLLNKSVEEGQHLLRNQNMSGTSLAEEMEDMTRDEILQELQEMRDVNEKLRSYVNRIILTILERNPSLLEITNANNNSS